MLKYLNWNISNKDIIITLKNRSLKDQVKPLMTFLIFRDHDKLLDGALDLQI
jgi:hypothetical protein